MKKALLVALAGVLIMSAGCCKKKYLVVGIRLTYPEVFNNHTVRVIIFDSENSDTLMEKTSDYSDGTQFYFLAVKNDHNYKVELLKDTLGEKVLYSDSLLNVNYEKRCYKLKKLEYEHNGELKNDQTLEVR